MEKEVDCVLRRDLTRRNGRTPQHRGKECCYRRHRRRERHPRSKWQPCWPVCLRISGSITMYMIIFKTYRTRLSISAVARSADGSRSSCIGRTATSRCFDCDRLRTRDRNINIRFRESLIRSLVDNASSNSWANIAKAGWRFAQLERNIA